MSSTTIGSESTESSGQGAENLPVKIQFLTLFPEMLRALSESGVSRRAIEKGLVKLGAFNPRDFTEDRHRTVDDKPYGGGPGMVMMVEPLEKALESALHEVQAECNQTRCAPRVIYLSPQGRPLDHALVCELAKEQSLVLVCGRYEGVDERFVERHVDDEIAIGDFVVSGGELPAMMLADAVIRQLPGALGSDESAEQDSFSGAGLLDYPHYTRPEVQGGDVVPDVLLSGDHARIAKWRFEQSLERTLKRRPDLLAAIDEEQLGKAERDSLRSLRVNKSGNRGD